MILYIYLFMYIMTVLCDMQDLGSPTRDGTHSPFIGR